MISSIFSGEVLRLAFGGEGIIQQNGLVVFVPFTAPGDIVEYRIKQCKKKFAYGELIKILRPAPDRVKPKCQYFGKCGGCQLQHLDYAAQLDYKRRSIEDALIRQAKLDNITVPPIIPAQQQWSYRRRISLTLKPVLGHFIACYTAADHTLLPVEQCPIFTGTEDQILSQVQRVVNTFKKVDYHEGRVAILKSHHGTYLVHFHFKVLPYNAEDVLNDAKQSYPNWKGILASSSKKTLQLGQIETQLEIDNLIFNFSPKAFIQNHPEQSQNIYFSLRKYARSLQPKKILDLYCGIGISSLLLAQEINQTIVIGVEANKDAIRMAKTNAEKNKIASVSFVQADVEEVLESQLKKMRPDLVIVNPPREGLSTNVAEALIAHHSSDILYISCMPPTLARDLKLLCDKAFQVNSIEAYDMFPQTSHVETLIHLKRTNKADLSL